VAVEKIKIRSELRQLKEKPIGVFDSGLGGLTVVREIMEMLPCEDIIYFGDLARLPYGVKSKKQIRIFSYEDTEFLLQHGVKALVIACNTSASVSLPFLKKRYDLPIIDVIFPTAEKAVKFSFAKRIGVIGTPATIQSRAYEKAIYGISPKVKVFSQACPLFVPLVEEGWLKGDIPKRVAAKYLQLLIENKIDTLILGCTHYPLLRETVQDYVGEQVVLIDSAGPTVASLTKTLKEKHLLCTREKFGKLRVFVSDFPRNFISVGERFLGCSLEGVRVIPIEQIIKNSVHETNGEKNGNENEEESHLSPVRRA